MTIDQVAPGNRVRVIRANSIEFKGKLGRVEAITKGGPTGPRVAIRMDATGFGVPFTAVFSPEDLEPESYLTS